MARQSRAGDADWLASAAAAFQTQQASPDSGSVALGVEGGAGAGVLAPASPFTLRRVVNPRYRPPTNPGAPVISPEARGRMRALDHFRAQLYRQESGGPQGFTQWELQGGEQYRSDNGVEVTAAGGHRFGTARLDALRIVGRSGAFEGTAVDAEPFAIGRVAYLQRLRGALLRYAHPAAGRWLALGGVPTPVPGAPTPRLALGGLAVEDVPFDEGMVSANVFGFWRGAPHALERASLGADTLSGRGALGTVGWRAPAAGGTLSGRLGAQVHGIDGPRALAAQHALEWSYQTPALVATISDERGTRRARVLGTDRLAAAPRREDRWNLQSRFAQGRAETHLTGVLRDGGDPLLASRTVQLGASGNFPGSAWYGGAEAVWDWRALTGVEERRLSIHGGGLLARGHAVLARVEETARGGDHASLTAMGEASLALPRGARLGLEPRLGWDADRFRQGDLTTRLSWPFGWLSTRISGSLTVGALREDGFRGGVREAAITVSLVPRLRDRADLELRRVDQDGRPLIEYSLAYDAMMERYDTPGQGWFAGRDTGRVTVRVVRSGNGSGVADILISLDGKELRFTDPDGVARFDRVPPGVHVVAIEERSLPANHEVVYASRVFVTVEPGRAPEPVSFAIARSERRSKF